MRAKKRHLFSKFGGRTVKGRFLRGCPGEQQQRKEKEKGGGGGHCVTAQLTVQQQQQHCLVLRLFLFFSSLFFAGKHIMKKDLAESGQV